MAGFKALRDACFNFEEELRKVSAELYSAKIGESFEDEVSKKMRDLSLFTSKLKLLRADTTTRAPQATESDKDPQAILSDYSDTAACSVVEHQTAKCVTQSHAVRELITTKDSLLDPEMVERKHKIISLLAEYSSEEGKLQQLDTMLRDKEIELMALRERWHVLLGEMREMRDSVRGTETEDFGPLYGPLKKTVEKIELVRWLISKLAIPRSRGYDWMSDPHNRLQALKMARQATTIDMFIGEES